MIKNVLITSALTLILLNACGPAAESRERMDVAANRTADSLNRSLDSALNDPSKELSKGNASITTLAPVNTSTEQDK